MKRTIKFLLPLFFEFLKTLLAPWFIIIASIFPNCKSTCACVDEITARISAKAIKLFFIGRNVLCKNTLIGILFLLKFNLFFVKCFFTIFKYSCANFFVVFVCCPSLNGHKNSCFPQFFYKD